MIAVIVFSPTTPPASSSLLLLYVCVDAALVVIICEETEDVTRRSLGLRASIRPRFFFSFLREFWSVVCRFIEEGSCVVIVLIFCLLNCCVIFESLCFKGIEYIV